MYVQCKAESTVRRKEFENVALFLQLGLPSTLIRHEHGRFRKRSSNWRNLKTSTLRFRVNGKHFEKGAYGKPWRHVSGPYSPIRPAKI